MEILKGTLDFYRCLHIKQPSLPVPFESILSSSISQWRSEKLKAVWLTIPTSQLELSGIAQKLGFYPHHVNSTGLQMALWLENRANSLPDYSTHYVGVGGVVFNENSEILLVKNRYSGIGVYNWRVPGGLVEANETILDGASRELREETRIETRPVGIIGFREKKNYQFERPDIYFLALLQPLNFQFVLDPEEITDCEWKNFQEWIDEDLPGDARVMLRNLYSDRSVKPFEFFQRICLRYSEMEYRSPNYNAIHYYHLNMNN
jgi:ADP-ribose pyrophosphatase YjhB (NUDIX family)